ncbi:MAG: hypothetical protein V1847_01455 [Candidatus Diapherotrites archaeon]
MGYWTLTSKGYKWIDDDIDDKRFVTEEEKQQQLEELLKSDRKRFLERNPPETPAPKVSPAIKPTNRFAAQQRKLNETRRKKILSRSSLRKPR